MVQSDGTPRLSFGEERVVLPRGQQPSVRLSDEGPHWLSERLDAAFNRYGQIVPAELEQPDSPELPVLRVG
jgi:hypothetical protein